jgi:hypothetical protein
LLDYKNIPIASSKNIPLALVAQCDGGFVSGHNRRRYTRADQIEKMAVEKYKKNGMGITFNDLLYRGLTSNKMQSQITLKHYRNKGILFTISARKPQQYYPVCIKSEISKAKLAKNIPVGVTEVGCSCKAYNISSRQPSNSNSTFYNLEPAIIQSLEGYVLPLLPSVPLHIHKIQFRLRISPECYEELSIPKCKGNNGKQHEEIIGKVRVSYYFYSNGTVMVFTESSNSPFRLEDEVDRSRLLTFFGQIRDRLITVLADRHERIVPDVLDWELTQCDINKDIQVGEALQYAGIKVQVKHFDRLFRVYIKSIGKDTACRVEQSLNPKKPTIQALTEILVGTTRDAQQPSMPCSYHNDDNTRKIAEIHDMLKGLLSLHNSNSVITIQPHELSRGDDAIMKNKTPTTVSIA